LCEWGVGASEIAYDLSSSKYGTDLKNLNISWLLAVKPKQMILYNYISNTQFLNMAAPSVNTTSYLN